MRALDGEVSRRKAVPVWPLDGVPVCVPKVGRGQESRTRLRKRVAEEENRWKASRSWREERRPMRNWET